MIQLQMTKSKNDKGKAVGLDRLVRHFKKRKKILNEEYEAYRGNKQMESVISGQLLEIEKTEQTFKIFS